MSRYTSISRGRADPHAVVSIASLPTNTCRGPRASTRSVSAVTGGAGGNTTDASAEHGHLILRRVRARRLPRRSGDVLHWHPTAFVVEPVEVAAELRAGERGQSLTFAAVGRRECDRDPLAERVHRPHEPDAIDIAVARHRQAGEPFEIERESPAVADLEMDA